MNQNIEICKNTHRNKMQAEEIFRIVLTFEKIKQAFADIK